jgi:hypothetical protein
MPRTDQPSKRQIRKQLAMYRIAVHRMIRAIAQPVYRHEIPTDVQLTGHRASDLREQPGGEVIANFAEYDEVEWPRRRIGCHIRAGDFDVWQAGTTCACTCDRGRGDIGCDKVLAYQGELRGEFSHGTTRFEAPAI